MVDKEGGVGMEDAAGFFANVFGGERFKDYVSVYCTHLGVPADKADADRRDFPHERNDLGRDDHDD